MADRRGQRVPTLPARLVHAGGTRARRQGLKHKERGGEFSRPFNVTCGSGIVMVVAMQEHE